MALRRHTHAQQPNRSRLKQTSAQPQAILASQLRFAPQAASHLMQPET
ncbi:hypothetical protein [Kingella oralis]|nr:hypothetical protein [Kingella oralis]